MDSGHMNSGHMDNFQTESFSGGCQDFMGQGGLDQGQSCDPTMADLSNMMQHTQLTAGGDFGGHNVGGMSLL